ncbi:MAG: hypothetical protein AB7S48_00335 [Bacteroidales bacterium]
MNLKLSITFAFLLGIHLGILAQNDSTDFFSSKEKSLSDLFKRIATETSAFKRDSFNNIFSENFEQTLKQDSSFFYPFDSLKHIGKLASNDNKIRIYTWNIPQSGGLYNYFGYLQIRNDSGKSILYKLRDSRNEVKDQNNERLSTDKWMAALYYQVADISINSQTYYILLGFDFNNLFSSKKIVDVLSFDNNENPVFGLPIFNVDNKMLLSRIVFEYSARAVFTLKYMPDQQMLIFDHLSPAKPEYLGDFQFYGPDSSFDGFKLENEKWTYVRDLDLRNPKREKIKPVEAPEKLSEPSFIYKPLYGKKN